MKENFNNPCKSCRIKEENLELKQINSETLSQLNLDNGRLIIENEKLKNMLKIVIRETWGEGWNYSLQIKVDAEKLLKELE